MKTSKLVVTTTLGIAIALGAYIESADAQRAPQRRRTVTIPSSNSNSNSGDLSENPNSITTLDGNTFYITEDNESKAIVGGVYLNNPELNPDQILVSRYVSPSPSIPNLFANQNSPNSVAIDLMGKVYVADTGNNEIDIFDSEKTLDTFLTANSPNFSLDGLQKNIVVNTGVFKKSLQRDFDNPNDVSINLVTGNIYVADTGNNKVDIFNSNLEFLHSLGGNGLFNNPNSVAINSANGNIYVADSGNNEVDIFNSDFKLLNSLKGFFSNPTDVEVDQSGNISVIDFDNKEVDWFSSNLKLNYSFDGYVNPTGLTVDRSGTVYVLEGGNFDFALGEGTRSKIDVLDTRAVPEPSSVLGILACGAVGSIFAFKRRLKKSNRHSNPA